MYKFIISNGSSSEDYLFGDFYDDYVVASEKANSVFVDRAMRTRGCSFSTYRTDIRVGSIVSVRGLAYKVRGVRIEADEASIISQIRGERYEN